MGSKRTNFDVSPEQDAMISSMRYALGSPSNKEAILTSARITSYLARELKMGKALCFREPNGALTRVVIPELASLQPTEWKFLVEHPHEWRRQLYIKGSKVMASRVYFDMLADKQTPEDAAADWRLPLEAIQEVIRYCEQERDLIEMEAQEEKMRLEEKGVSLEPKSVA